MSTQRTLSQSILQVIFSIFLGLVVVAFVGIAVNTFYPEPDPGMLPYDDKFFATWRLVTGIALLISATVVMVVSMIRSEAIPVISNGLLLGGLFTMIYAVGMSISAQNQWPRLAVVAVALVVTLGVGYWKYVRRRESAQARQAEAPAGTDDALAGRVTALEAKLEAIGRALSSEA